jgi:hypothetical protein
MKDRGVSMLFAALKFYLAINALLILSYAFLKVARIVAESARIPISYLNLNRVAQVLLLTSLLSPAVLSLLPRESVPNFKIEIRTPLADTLSPERPEDKLHRTSQGADIQRTLLQPAEQKQEIDVNLVIVIAISLGFFYAVIKTGVQLLQLFGLLRKAVLVRRIGKIRILVSENITIPFSTLIGGANVVVPLDAISNFRNLRLIVRHEFHHHRNGDTLWILAMEALRCLFCLNPVIHLWKREITEIQEFACDESLISQMRVSAYEYGQCLVQVAEAARGNSLLQVGTTCMGGSPKGPQQLKSFLRRRIEVFKDHETSRKHRFLGIALGTVGVLVTTGLSYGAQKSLRGESHPKPNSGLAKFDSDIQATTEGILAKYVKKFGAKGGFVLVADPQTGRVLAVANQLSAKRKLDKSWALSYEIEPASTQGLRI